MDGSVVWKQELQFEGMGKSGFIVPMDAQLSKENASVGCSPMELMALSLAACTAMDVISILQKKREKITAFEVKIHADRTPEYPKVFTQAALEYVFSGQGLSEDAAVRAIELSVEKYCPVYAMLSQVFPIALRYTIFETEDSAAPRVVAEGTYMPHEIE